MFDGHGATHTPDLAAHVGPAGWARLAPAVRRRFGGPHQARTYHGTLDLQRSPVGWAFAQLGRLLGRPLPCRAGLGVPATVQVAPARAGVRWERLLRFGPGQVERVASTKETGPDGHLWERTGWLAMELHLSEDAGALVFRSRRYLLQLGRWRVPVPLLLTPGTCEVRHADAGPGRFRFTLTARHPVWGLTFHQDGFFTDHQEQQEHMPC